MWDSRARLASARARYGRLPAAMLVAMVLWLLWLQSSSRWMRGTVTQGSGLLRAILPRDRGTLVVYIFSFTDLEYQENLYYFLEHGVRADDGVDYLIVMQEGNSTMGATELPSVPDNVRIVTHPNGCFDWGTFGWAIQSGAVDARRYRYILFVNSSVRGPFLPPYWPPELHWTEVFTSRLSDSVKLVGSTISCEGAWKGGVLTGEFRQNPHVQSYVVAMDQVGFFLLVGGDTGLEKGTGRALRGRRVLFRAEAAIFSIVLEPHTILPSFMHSLLGIAGHLARRRKRVAVLRLVSRCRVVRRVGGWYLACPQHGHQTQLPLCTS